MPLPSFVPRLWSNWLTLLGTLIATLAGLTIVLMFAVEFAAGESNTYLSTALFLALPVLFVFGLLLIPLGLYVHRHSQPSVTLTTLADAWSQLSRERSFRNKLIFIGVATVANVLIFGAAGHKAVSYLDSPRFCGTACHTVMQPEWTAYNRSSHSRVACVACHIGPGASWAVRSKIDGLRQVWRVATDSYDRPVPTPVHTLRPSRDTCETCHWPEKFQGNRLKVFPHFQDDQANTPAYNAVLLKVGGSIPGSEKLHGIHWHVSPDIKVKYWALDPKREKVGRVEVIEGGKVRAAFEPAEGGQGGEERVMDCIDCHNRPTHTFALSVAEAVDRAFDTRQLDRSVPFLRKHAVGVLSGLKVGHEQAEAAIEKALTEAYAKEEVEGRPDAAKLKQAAAVLAEAYRRNVFPEMKVTWGTYPSHLGHREEEGSSGCFRCHGGEHKTADGKKLSRACEKCHSVLANEEDPANFDETLKTLVGTPP